MSTIKSIKQVLGLGPAAENHFWDGSVPNQLTLKRGTPEAPGATVMQVVDGAVSFPQGVGIVSRIGLVSAWAVPTAMTVVPCEYNYFNEGISHVGDALVVPKKGVYQIEVSGHFDLNSDSALLGIRVDGATSPTFGGALAAGFQYRISGSYTARLNANSTIQMIAQRGGTACNLVNGESTWLSAFLIKELP